MDRQDRYVKKIDVVTILKMKSQLKKKQLLEPVLSTNLDYAARVMAHMHGAILYEATLRIVGERVLVKFIPNNHIRDSYMAQPNRSNIHFTVICNDGQPQLRRYVSCDDVITDSDIKDAHFLGHSCQDMIEPCSQQARALVSRGNRDGITELRIICNNMSLIYYSIDEKGRNVVSHSPQTSYILKTHCRLSFPDRSKIEQLLEMKCWIEQEKPQKLGLIACVDHLLKQFTELPNAPQSQCIFTLQSDGEFIQLFESPNQAHSGLFNRKYYIFGGRNGVSMFPAQWF